LQSIHLHHIRQNRRSQCNAFLTVWYPNHGKGAKQPTIEEYWPHPGDPEWAPPRKKKDSLQEHIKMMPEVGEDGPPEKED
jgi:hypothetical protein